jgi:cysteine desulfurase
MSVYLDWAATEPMWPEVSQEYVDTLQLVGNPSSIHRDGQHARALLDEARETLARTVGADPMEVIFTSGATEAINTWLKGRVFTARQDGHRPVLVSPRAEHHATLDALLWLEGQNLAEVRWIDVDPQGVIDLDMLEAVLSGPEANRIVGVTTLAANNEVGSLQPVDGVVDVASHHGHPVHVDAVGMFGHLPFRWASRGLDAMSISAHKVGGPVGVGALIVSRNAAAFEGLLHGGAQQTHRSGTLDVAGAVAFAKAVELQMAAMGSEAARLAGLRDRLKAGIDGSGVEVVWRGDPLSRLPHNLHLTVPGCEGDVMLYLLDERGISVSTGSACQAGVPEPSHVLLAMGVDEKTAKGALRFTLGRTTTEADIDRVIDVFPEVVATAKQAAPA